MNSFNGTIAKFLSVLNVDTVYDIECIGTNYCGKCICGQPIKYGYKVKNVRNELECIVGKTCSKYILKHIHLNNIIP